MAEPIFPVPAGWAATAHVDAAAYARLHAQSLADPEAFWAREARIIDWVRPPSVADASSFNAADFGIRWFADGQLNVAANCLDRHLATRANQPAIIWEGDDPADSRILTYADLHALTCRIANVLKGEGVRPGDRVILYLPMIPEAAAAMLACARIGAIHAVVFGGFSPEALAGRIQDCGARIIITADEGLRAGKHVPLKANVDAALGHCPDVERVLVVRRTGGTVAMQPGRDLYLDELLPHVAATCPPEVMDAESPLFILYTSGSTGKPKGVVHSSGGYLVWAALTHHHVFDHRPGEVYWCTADIGWVTGHSYGVYGPLANGATSLMFEGVPSHPDHGRFWQIVEKWRVATLYTAPTAIRALMREGEDWVKAHDLSSLRLLGSVGEPINPEAWDWYHRVVGGRRCPIVDTWWQTETGGALITPLPGATALKPGSASLPMFGVEPVLVDGEGRPLDGATEGNLCLARSWPGQMMGIWGEPARFFDAYFATFPGLYFTGDGCRRDADGYHWITGRVDDVINVSGHRMGSAEVESALVAHPLVAEAAVVGVAHDLKGQGIYAYVILNAGEEASESLRRELIAWVRRDIGPIATPDAIHFAPGLPKTRSGKIMRRILRKIAENDTASLGDTSTLADPTVVEALIDTRPVPA
jgi:acetyl-CoA synthetase